MQSTASLRRECVFLQGINVRDSPLAGLKYLTVKGYGLEKFTCGVGEHSGLIWADCGVS
jgi:hypothetical protein